jgi:hypothetical protein
VTDRNTPARTVKNLRLPVKGGELIYAGALVMMDTSAYALAGATATAKRGVGIAKQRVDNSNGGDGDLTVEIERGCFRFDNSTSTDAITQADIGSTCYIVDDHTVAKTDGGGTRSSAGQIRDVDDQGVWVELGYVDGPVSGSLAAANDLSDVASKSTSRSNLGVYEKMGAPVITVGAEAAHVINVAIQLRDSANADLAVRGSLLAYISDDANGDSVAATAPDTVAIGADGLAIPLVAGKTFLLTSEADGDIDINITNAAADTFYLILRTPDGKLVASDAITFAG